MKKQLEGQKCSEISTGLRNQARDGIGNRILPLLGIRLTNQLWGHTGRNLCSQLSNKLKEFEND